MPSKVESHFEEYREQTRVKHDILSKYLGAYFSIRAKADHPNLVYIDAFAGCGEYQSTSGPQPGSPLRALARFSELKAEVRGRITSIFVEEDSGYHSQLAASVANFDPTSRGLRQPLVLHGTFDECVDRILTDLESRGQRMAPSFLFADPCGVAGLTFQTLARFLRDGNGELFLFFNYDAVKRIAGLEHKPGGALSLLLGSDDAALSLRASLNALPVDQKEAYIMSVYQTLIDAAVVGTYSTSFRIEYEHKRLTSHYFIHLTRNELGFRIMKEVMWPLGRTAEGDGGLEFEQASLAGGQLLFRPRWDDVRNGILAELSVNGGRLSARYFYETLSCRKQNVLCRQAYKAALLELERQGLVVVFGKDGQATTASGRKKHKGQPTLGEDCIIRIADGGRGAQHRDI